MDVLLVTGIDPERFPFGFLIEWPYTPANNAEKKIIDKIKQELANPKYDKAVEFRHYTAYEEVTGLSTIPIPCTVNIINEITIYIE